MERYWREIALVLAVKALVLALVWYAWFSSPEDKSLSDAGVAARMLSPQSQILKESNHGAIR